MYVYTPVFEAAAPLCLWYGHGPALMNDFQGLCE
jgi:hypothetical protein